MGRLRERLWVMAECGHICERWTENCCLCQFGRSYTNRCEVCRERAETPPKGTHKLVPKTKRHLLLDLDTEASVRQFVENLSSVAQRFHVRKVRIWPSKSKGTHAEVELGCTPENHHEVCFLQMFLGSDPVREWLNYTTDQHNLLFKPNVFGERCE